MKLINLSYTIENGMIIYKVFSVSAKNDFYKELIYEID